MIKIVGRIIDELQSWRIFRESRLLWSPSGDKLQGQRHVLDKAGRALHPGSIDIDPGQWLRPGDSFPRQFQIRREDTDNNF